MTKRQAVYSLFIVFVFRSWRSATDRIGAAGPLRAAGGTR
jgi:hypothetical protein